MSTHLHLMINLGVFLFCSENTVVKTSHHFYQCQLRHGRLQADEGAADELRAGSLLSP